MFTSLCIFLLELVSFPSQTARGLVLESSFKTSRRHVTIYTPQRNSLHHEVSSAHHLAAFLTAVGSPLEVEKRPTPTPGPAKPLIEVKSIALNPVDYMQRETGFHISHKPAILGSDVAGALVASGSAITDPSFKPGARVSAFAATFWKEVYPTTEECSSAGGGQKPWLLYCPRERSLFRVPKYAWSMVVESRLRSLNQALDTLKNGVSVEKLVLET